MKNKEALIMAEQQLLGFIHGIRGYSLIELISSMKLTAEERKDLKKEYGLSYMDKEEEKEIDNYFNN